MSKQAIDYGKEFDEHVKLYNEWLVLQEDPKVQKKNKRKASTYAFLKGISSVLDLSGKYSSDQFNYNEEDKSPLNNRNNLSQEQKELIKHASDWITLERILSNELSKGNISVESAKEHKQDIEKKYNSIRRTYVSYAMRK